MAQALRCDEHPDVAGVLLVQNLAEGEIKVACPQCVPACVRALADAIGLTEQIAQEAQANLINEVERAQVATQRPRKRTAAKKTAPAGQTEAGPAPAQAVEA